MTESDLLPKVMRNLVEKYGYSEDQIAVQVRFESKKGPPIVVDLVVYKTVNKKMPWILVEVKSRLHFLTGMPIMERALILSNAKYAVLTDGVKEYCLTKTPDNLIFSISSIPDADGTISEFPNKKDLHAPSDLESRLWRIADILRGRMSIDEILVELKKLLLCKIYDEISSAKKVRFWVTGPELAREDGDIIGKFQARFGSMLEHASEKFAGIVTEGNHFGMDSTDLMKCVSEFQDISLSANPEGAVLHISGLLSRLSSKMGKKGSFQTPLSVAEFAVEMLDLSSDQWFIDPLCGSGEFVLAAVRNIKEKAKQRTPIVTDSQVYAAEKTTPQASLAKLLLVISGFSPENILNVDSLIPDSPIDQLSKKIGGFNAIASAPPFNIHYIEGQEIKRFADMLGTASPDVSAITIAKSYDWLNVHGRLAIILPEGVLFNSKNHGLRKFILDRMRVLAIVSLPPELSHHSVRIRTNLVILERPDKKPKNDYEVFMALLDEYNPRLIKNQFDEILEDYNQFKSGKKLKSSIAFAFSKKALGIERWDVSYHRPAGPPMYGKGVVLEDICEIIPGARIRSEEYSDSSDDIPYLRISDIKGGKVVLDRTRYVADESVTGKVMLKAGDLILSVRGTIGKIAQVSKTLEGAVPASQLVILRPNKSKVTPSYLRAVIGSHKIQKVLNRLKRGQIISGLGIRDLKQVRIPLLPMNEQKAFAKKFESLLKDAEEYEKKAETARSEAASLLEGVYHESE